MSIDLRHISRDLERIRGEIRRSDDQVNDTVIDSANKVVEIAESLRDELARKLPRFQKMTKYS